MTKKSKFEGVPHKQIVAYGRLIANNPELAVYLDIHYGPPRVDEAKAYVNGMQDRAREEARRRNLPFLTDGGRLS